MAKKKSKKTFYRTHLKPYLKLSRRNLLLTGLLLAVIGGAVVWFSHASQPSAWPNLYHKAGATGLPLTSEFSEFKAMGLSIISPNCHVDAASDLGKQITAAGLTYIDRTPQQYIYNAYSNAYDAAHPHSESKCSTDPEHCTLSDTQKTDLLSKISSWLAATKDDKNIVGYYLLDDYWANMRDVLDKTAKLIADTNRSAPFARPTICGYGASIDWQELPDTFDKKIQNYSPTFCNLIAMYIYGHHGHDIAKIKAEDYTMSNLLPALKEKFKQAGWDGKEFIGIPQAFYSPRNVDGANYSAVTAPQIARQVEAFCKFGATTIMPWIWGPGSTDYVTLAQRADYRGAVVKGLSNCEQYWYADEIKSLREAGLKAINGRVPKLQQLKDRVSASHLLTTQKSALDSFLDSQISGLNQLKRRLLADKTRASLKTDNPDIKDNFRVFNFSVPKVNLMLRGDQMTQDIKTAKAKVLKISQTNPPTKPKINSIIVGLDSLNTQVRHIEALTLVISLDQYKANSAVLDQQSHQLDNLSRTLDSLKKQIDDL